MKTQKIKQLKSPEKRKAVVPGIKVLFNHVVTSAHNVHSNSRIITQNVMSHRQVVVAAGPNAEVKVGDWVAINIDMFPKETKPGKHDIGNKVIIHPPIEKIDGVEYLFITDRHIKYVINKDVAE